MNLKTALVVSLVGSMAGAGGAWFAYTQTNAKPAVSQTASAPSTGGSATTQPASATPNEPPAVSAEEVQAANEALMLQVIEDMLAHPQDPQNPLGVEGISDEGIAAYDLGQVQELLDETYDAALQNLDEPRHMFALGRMALIHGDDELAEALLTQAADAGSAAAHAYLAELAEDAGAQEAHLQTAAAGGFKPAEDWLALVAQANTDSAHMQGQSALSTTQPAQAFDPHYFIRSDLMSAFYSGDLAAIKEQPLEVVTYISNVQSFLMNTSQVLFVVEDRNIVREVDPTLSYDIQRKLANSPALVGDAVATGFEPFAKMLTSMAETRRAGGSVMDEVNATLSSLTTTRQFSLGELGGQATKDAERLALMYEFNADAFRRIYSGMKQYIRSS